MDDDAGNGTLAATGGRATFAWALRSEPGDVRPHNEDFAGCFVPDGPDEGWDRGPLFVVADGLGGHAAGEVASRTAVEVSLSAWRDEAAGAPHQRLRTVVRDANTAVINASLDGDRRGMGTTITAVSLAGRQAVLAHVGDSRAYLIREGDCTQLTTDHSRVGELLRMKLITPEQAANHPARSQLTRSLGADMAVQVDVTTHGLGRGDAIVLCSDGLWDVVSRREIADIAGRGEPGETADSLVKLALERSSPDNVTVLAVHLLSDAPVPAAAPRRSLFRRR